MGTPVRPDYVCKTQYLSEDPELLRQLEGKRYVFLSAPMGRGKTQLVRKLTENQTLLGQCHRLSLTRSLGKDLDARTHVEDQGKDLADLDRLVLTPNSAPYQLMRGRVRVRPYDNFVLEEFTQLFRHVSTDSYQGRREEAIGMWEFFGHSSKRVFFLDAQMTEEEVGLACRILGCTREDVFVVGSEWQNPLSLEIYYKKEAVLKAALADLMAGHRIWVASDSRTHTEAMARQARDTVPGIRILLINGETSGDEHVLEFLANPNEESWKYDLVLVSPSVTSGLSVTCDAFERIYSFVCGRVMTGSDVVQQIRRVRNPRDSVIRMYVNPSSGWRPQEELDELEESSVVLKTGVVSDIQRIADDGVVEMQYALSLRLIAGTRVLEARQKNRPLEGILLACQREDINVSFVRGSESRAVLEAYEEAREIVRQEKNEAVLAAEELDESLAAMIASRRNVDPEERASLLKFSMQQRLNLQPEDITLELVDAYLHEDLSEREQA
jgi:hypothetical protein